MSKRREFTAKTKLAAFERAMRCCENCGVNIRPGNGPEYHHINPAYFDGDNDLDNCKVLCKNCHGEQTTKVDIKNISKSRRIIKRNAGIKKRSSFRRPSGMKYNWQRGRYEQT